MLPTDSPTGVDDPAYENITLTFRNRDQPKSSHSPPKKQGEQPPTSPHPTALGWVHGRALLEQQKHVKVRVSGVGCGGIKACV